MSAAVELAQAPGSGGVVPSGAPVLRGRVHLGRLRSLLPSRGTLAVVAGFGAVCWLGAPDDPAPGLGPMAYRTDAAADGRGRVVLDRRVRAWRAVEDPAGFEALLMPAPSGGVLVVPEDDFARRIGEVTP